MSTESADVPVDENEEDDLYILNTGIQYTWGAFLSEETI